MCDWPWLSRRLHLRTTKMYTQTWPLWPKPLWTWSHLYCWTQWQPNLQMWTWFDSQPRHYYWMQTRMYCWPWLWITWLYLWKSKVSEFLLWLVPIFLWKIDSKNYAENILNPKRISFVSKDHFPVTYFLTLHLLQDFTRGNIKSDHEKWSTFKYWPIKNPHSLSHPFETLQIWLFQLLITFTKFDEDWTKNVDLLLMANFFLDLKKVIRIATPLPNIK